MDNTLTNVISTLKDTDQVIDKIRATQAGDPVRHEFNRQIISMTNFIKGINAQKRALRKKK